MRRLLTLRWLARHLAAAVLVVAFLALGRWQYGRATDGNALSWAYALQWPLFALFVVAMWIRLVRAEISTTPQAPPPPLRPKASTRAAATTATETTATETTATETTATALHDVYEPTGDVDPDDEHAAYNRYLAWLAANPDRRPSEYPG